MENFEPQIDLWREPVIGGSDSYSMTVTIQCPDSNFEKTGHSFDDSGLASGLFVVVIDLDQNLDVSGNNQTTNLVTDVEIGSINFPDGEGDIRVDVNLPTAWFSANQTEPVRPTNTGGSGAVSSPTGRPRPRPM